MPATPNPSMPGEAFMDTQMVNGTVFPYLHVEPKRYRFRILNAGDDRSLNLQFYVAADNTSPTTAAVVLRPSNVTANKLKGKSLLLHWKDNSNNETGFRIEWANNRKFTKNFQFADVGADVTSYQVTGLSPANNISLEFKHLMPLMYLLGQISYMLPQLLDLLVIFQKPPLLQLRQFCVME